MPKIEANDRDLSGFPRLIEGDPLRDAAWAELGFRVQRTCERELKRQKRMAFCKWLMVVAGTVIVIVLALVWTNQIP